MEFNLKQQWRVDDSEEEENQETGADHRMIPSPNPPSSSALPLFFSESNSPSLPYYSHDHHPNTPLLSPPKVPRMGSCFSLTQWQELELQALIYRHMTAGAAVPQELLHLVKKSLVNSPFYPHNHYYYPHYQPPLLQAGYLGRGAMDPEPGRCRRTDGKKWRCSRDVVTGQKYCERHMHRGRNRSRKPVDNAAGPYGGEAPKGNYAGGGGGAFTLTATVASRSAADLHLNQRQCDSMTETKGHFEPQPNGHSTGQTLRHFFDDWPKPLQDADNVAAYSATNLSISMLENSSSDFSLTLGTGIRDESSGQIPRGQRNNNNRLHQMMSWEMAWENSPVAPMGGPLAEALRLAAANSSASPTSVLQRPPHATIS